MRRLKIILQSKYLFKIICGICIAYSVLFAFYFPSNSKYSIKDNEIVGQVVEYQIEPDRIKLTIKGKEKIIAYYYFKSEAEKNTYKEKIQLGVSLKLIGKLQVPQNNTIPNGFNYKNYLKYKNINYYMYITNIEILKNNTSVFYFLKNKLIKRIDDIDATGYLRTFILGDKTLLDEAITTTYQQNGVSHLFSVSGMHVSLMVGMLMFILNKVSYSNFYKYGIIIPFLIFYLHLTGVGASILRTVIMFIVFALNKCFNLKIKRIDLMLIVLIIAILLKPFIIFDMGFQFSYSISFALVVLHKKISSVKKKWHQNLVTSFISFLISFPICIYYYSSVNVLSILLNLIMIPLVSIIIFPITLLTLIIPIIYPIYEVLICFLEQISIFASKIKILELVISKPSIILIIIYYIIIFLALWKKQFFILFIVVIFIHKNYLYLDNSFLFTLIDVGQGDSIFIKLPNNQGNILIDTGGQLKLTKEGIQQNNYSIVTNSTIPYLKSLGINKLDYLIITHGDYDHMGEAINLVNNFKVENVIFNNDEYNDLELELIAILKDKNIKYYQNIKKLNVDNNKLYFLNNKLYDNENDNSNVIYTEFNGIKLLLMGDASVEVEEDILDRYNLNDIDILKVGHHGSKTSSGEKFIESINPKYSIISVGKNNRYGHPNDSILDNLEESKIYRTDLDGSVIFKIKNSKLEIETCAP